MKKVLCHFAKRFCRSHARGRQKKAPKASKRVDALGSVAPCLEMGVLQISALALIISCVKRDENIYKA